MHYIDQASPLRPSSCTPLKLLDKTWLPNWQGRWSLFSLVLQNAYVVLNNRRVSKSELFV